MSDQESKEPETFHYQVIDVHGMSLRTRLSFWAENDDHAKLLAGDVPRGAVLVRMVDR